MAAQVTFVLAAFIVQEDHNMEFPVLQEHLTMLLGYSRKHSVLLAVQENIVQQLV